MAWQYQFELLSRPYGGVTEGPVWDGEAILFTHIPTSRIMRYDPNSHTGAGAITDAITEIRGGANHSNGLAFDNRGNLFGCCSGGRAIVRFDDDGSNVAVADRVDGQKLNTPNDLAIDRRGRIWFTNPWNAGNIDPARWRNWTTARCCGPTPRPTAAIPLPASPLIPLCPTASWSPRTSVPSTWRKATASGWT